MASEKCPPSFEQGQEFDDLKAKVSELEETLRAIRSGEVDAILVNVNGKDQVFTLRGADEPYRVLFEQMNEGAITLSDDGDILYCNRAFANGIGISLEKIISTKVENYISLSDLNLFKKMLAESDFKSVREEVMFQRVDGKVIPMQVSISTAQTGDMHVKCVIAADLTEHLAAEAALKKANEDLEQKVQERTRDLKRSNEDLRQFAYVASHDLQEPLRMVSSYLGLLERREGDKLDEKSREFVQFALDGSERMKELIQDLLQYSRVETKSIEFATVDMNDVVRNVLQSLEPALRESDAEIKCENLPCVSADQSQMIQLLQNLIGNAIKFRGKERPVVEISAADDGWYWRLAIKDNGIGIKPDYWQRIFDPFQRLHTREEYPGTGVGLAICKKIVERHGGQIWVESQPGKGSTFFFTIPKNGQ